MQIRGRLAIYSPGDGTGPDWRAPELCECAPNANPAPMEPKGLI